MTVLISQMTTHRINQKPSTHTGLRWRGRETAGRLREGAGECHRKVPDTQ